VLHSRVNSLYLHIPFCLSKCFYCSFSSYPGLESLHESYCAALCQDIRQSYRDRHGTPLDSLFLGGGTPTVLNLTQLIGISETCRDVYGFHPDAEISIEANPGTVTPADLQGLRKAGFNRISMGMQSCHDTELEGLGRRHDAAQSFSAFTDARQAGFSNISLDLMYGLPDQSPERWHQTLERVLAMQPEHLSLYQLTLEEGTDFYRRFEQGLMHLPGEEAILEMDAITVALTRRKGFSQYEISNFCRPGFECRHNIVYWSNDEYLACGAGAVSYLNGGRSRRIIDPAQYADAVLQGKPVVAESEELDSDAAFRETVVMGLRLFEGISENRLIKRFGRTYSEVYGDSLVKLVKDGLLERQGAVLALTEKGRRFANIVMAELV
jgi:oxygen-independent coproporphyrinogen-3 oxidase